MKETDKGIFKMEEDKIHKNCSTILYNKKSVMGNYTRTLFALKFNMMKVENEDEFLSQIHKALVLRQSAFQAYDNKDFILSAEFHEAAFKLEYGAKMIPNAIPLFGAYFIAAANLLLDSDAPNVCTLLNRIISLLETKIEEVGKNSESDKDDCLDAELHRVTGFCYYKLGVTLNDISYVQKSKELTLESISLYNSARKSPIQSKIELAKESLETIEDRIEQMEQETSDKALTIDQLLEAVVDTADIKDNSNTSSPTMIEAMRTVVKIQQLYGNVEVDIELKPAGAESDVESDNLEG